MGLSTWGWGTACGGLVTSWGWGECPCPDFIPGVETEDPCSLNTKECVDVRLRPDDLQVRLRPSDLSLRTRPSDLASRRVDDPGSRTRPDDIPSRSTICDE